MTFGGYSDFDMLTWMDHLLRHIREKFPNLPFIMLTGSDSKGTAIEALNSGADFCRIRLKIWKSRAGPFHKITIS